MGAAIGVFEGARALHVPRERFAPVKTTDDLLALRSDAYVLTARTRASRSRRSATAARRSSTLDSDHYKLVRDFDARFPAGPAVARRVRALRGATATSRSARGVVARGRVEVDNDGDGRLEIEDGAVLGG